MDQNPIPSSPLPPPVLSNEEKNWGLFCHLAGIVGFVFPFGNLIGPLIIWLVKRDQFAFVNVHGKESLNFQITVLLAALALTLCTVFSCGILGVLTVPGFIALGIADLIMMIIAAIKASNGEYYQYPFCIRWVK